MAMTGVAAAGNSCGGGGTPVNRLLTRPLPPPPVPPRPSKERVAEALAKTRKNGDAGIRSRPVAPKPQSVPTRRAPPPPNGSRKSTPPSGTADQPLHKDASTGTKLVSQEAGNRPLPHKDAGGEAFQTVQNRVEVSTVLRAAPAEPTLRAAAPLACCVVVAGPPSAGDGPSSVLRLLKNPVPDENLNLLSSHAVKSKTSKVVTFSSVAKSNSALEETAALGVADYDVPDLGRRTPLGLEPTSLGCFPHVLPTGQHRHEGRRNTLLVVDNTPQVSDTRLASNNPRVSDVSLPATGLLAASNTTRVSDVSLPPTGLLAASNTPRVLDVSLPAAGLPAASNTTRVSDVSLPPTGLLAASNNPRVLDVSLPAAGLPAASNTPRVSDVSLPPTDLLAASNNPRVLDVFLPAAGLPAASNNPRVPDMSPPAADLLVASNNPRVPDMSPPATGLLAASNSPLVEDLIVELKESSQQRSRGEGVGPHIHHSNWFQVCGDGTAVRYSTCQITLQDVPNGGSDYRDDSRRRVMASLTGLPPLPKSLSGADLSGGGAEPLLEHPTPAQRGGYRQQGAAARVDVPVPRTRKATRLDAQLAVLRKEMFGLRQLDLSLLSQLWSLNQSIQEFRQLLQDQEDNAALSPPSPSSADEGEEFYSPVRYHAPPQLPPGLQQLAAVPEQYQLSSSSSQSSIEYGDV